MKKLKIFIDTNIILDLLLERQGFYEYSAKIFELSADQKIFLFTSSISISNISYILRKDIKKINKMKEHITDLISIIKVLPVSENTIKFALDTDFSDIEDSIQYSCAFENNMDYIVTRNKRDYKNSIIKILDSKEFIEII